MAVLIVEDGKAGGVKGTPLGTGHRPVELVAAMEDRAQQMTRLPAKPDHRLLERGPDIHTFGNQRHRGRPDVVIERSHHDLRRSP